MKVFHTQYKLLFLLSWIIFYLIFPSWVFPVSIAGRAGVFFGLLIFFLISAQLISRWVKMLSVDKPPLVYTDFKKYVKDNKGLFIVCFIAVILHINSVTYPILNMGDEALHLQDGLWLYEYIDISWHRLFQIVFWVLVGSIFLILKLKNGSRFLTEISNKRFIAGSTNNFPKNLCLFLIPVVSVIYFLLLKDIPFFQSSFRYPPGSKFLYLITYAALGITHVGPRILELAFTVLSAVYLYRTINLFNGNASSLIGASIYLFFPVVFTYARLGELACGTVFFIILISFYFIRFIKNDDNRDLLLTSYFIGIGFLYKEQVFLMFFICFAFLFLYKMTKSDFHKIIHFNILFLSLVPIIPWMYFAQLYSWRHYKIIWSNFRPFDGKVFAFFLHFPLDISWMLFSLFLVSIVFILVAKKNILTLFFGFLFIGYYFFLVLDIGNYSPRLYMALYPAIAVFISQLLSSIIDNIRWKHSFKIIYAVLFVYLISICTVPSINAKFMSSDEFKKLNYFPNDEAMLWVKKNVKDGEKIVTLRILSSSFYRDKYRIDKNKIIAFTYDLNDVSTPEKLKTFYKENKISYIMFPTISGNVPILGYLNKNPGEEFIEVARFNMDKNYIYIYRLRHS